MPGNFVCNNTVIEYQTTIGLHRGKLSVPEVHWQMDFILSSSGNPYPFASFGGLSRTRYMTSLSFQEKLCLHVLGI